MVLHSRTLLQVDTRWTLSRWKWKEKSRKHFLKNTDISSVHSFEFEKKRRKLTCSFTVETVYGTTGGEVTI